MSVNVVRDNIVNKNLMPKYRSLIENLYAQYKVIPSNITKDGVNFSGNRMMPRHRWFYYKEAFSTIVVEKFLNENNINDGDWIIDPFSGIGTTLFECQKRKINSVGFDIAPVPHFVSTVKNENYSKQDVCFLKEYLFTFNKEHEVSENVPVYKKFNELFTPNLTREILMIKAFYENCSNCKVRELLKLAYLSIVGEYCNRVKDGNGLKKKKNYNPPDSLIPIFIEKINTYVSDICEGPRVYKKNKPIIIQDSVINSGEYKLAKEKKYHGAIFSPPYPNCFDYTEVYKIEMWLGEFINDVKDLRPYRDIMIRSAVNCKFNFEIENKNKDIDLICEYLSTFNIWNERIPNMIKGYFDDMTAVLRKLYNSLHKGGSVYIVVANSCYKSVLIPTDALFCKIGELIGFSVIGIEEVRKIRASSQQMSADVGYLSNMRESIVKLRK